ncbi:hypothetical protein GALMADRAFT_257784 [Galerina marginata CBS 339.88]|uniref:Uncharacterized protein n=1 Tax=Galerina marginata (strain CBS 339.88) TaxID=685588 RepID=A0A067SJJ0_GALM3|nr:hypothetical protein GALMADRAFT_257784 [Galerina marginata CBS 339.88]
MEDITNATIRTGSGGTGLKGAGGRGGDVASGNVGDPALQGLPENIRNIETGNGGAGNTGGRGGDIGCGNTNRSSADTSNHVEVFLDKGQHMFNEFVSGLRGNGNSGNTIIHNAGNTLNQSSSNTSLDNSTRTNNDYSVHSTWTPQSPSPYPSSASSTFPFRSRPLTSPGDSPEAESIGSSSNPPAGLSRMSSNSSQPSTAAVQPSDQDEDRSRRRAHNPERDSGNSPDRAVETASLDDVLITLLGSVNHDSEVIARQLVSSIDPKYLAHELRRTILAIYPQRQNSYIAEFLRIQIKAGAVGLDVAQLSVQCLFNAVLLEHIFGKFSPGLGEDMNDELSNMYDRIRCNESPEHIALWRSITYLHSKPEYDDQKHAKVVTTDFLCAVRDFFPTLLPPTTSMSLPNIVSTFKASVMITVLKAMKLQNLARTHSGPVAYEVFIPKPKSHFNATTAGVHSRVHSRSGSSHDGGDENRVLGCTKLGLHIIFGHALEKLEILSKAEIVLG